MGEAQAGISCKPGFMKLVVENADETARFYCDVFGMVRTDTLDLEPLLEVFLGWPGHDFSLILVAYKRTFPIQNGNNWGPIGFETNDLDGLIARALAAGATVKVPAGTLDTLRYVILESPQGHEIELIQHL
jgi:catechol 2,3-dioxygenase-like lactoylglutathione lyase family enzyme